MLKLLGAALAAFIASSSLALAQTWPDRPVTMIVPFAAGGPVDTVGRIMGQRLSETLGQNVVIENVGGAGGMIGAQRVAQAAPDGYTILLGGSAVLALNQAIYKKPLVDGAKDFEFVSMFADSARLLITRKDFPANTLAEFNAYAKANHGKMQYGSAGAGSGSHVCAVLLESINGTKIAHVPYRGSGPAMQDLVAGRLDYIPEQISTAVSHIEAGTVKAIAVLGLERVSVLPKLPTSLEAGHAGPRLRLLGDIVAAQGHTGRHRQEAGRAVERGRREPGRARTAGEDRRVDPRQGAPHVRSTSPSSRPRRSNAGARRSARPAFRWIEALTTTHAHLVHCREAV